MNAFLVAGTHSGSGKTTITLGLMAALERLGHRVAPFKCGPDFIDPSLHTLVTGRVSRNLDLWMAGEDFSYNTFYSNIGKGDTAVVEGVMGMFDGGRSSSAALAEKLGIPLILVLDVRSMAESAAAVLKGFESLNLGAAPAGVILNMVGSERHLQLVSDAIGEHCRAEILGHMPRNISFSIPSRHLGLHMGEESPVSRESIGELAETIIRHINVDRLLELSDVQPRTVEKAESAPMESRVRIGVARDKAFCFYYQDNLDILEQCGAEIVPFSPLADSCLPEGLSGLYLGGGYPELYGKELSSNVQMIEAIRSLHDRGITIYSECGGFMYLTEGITDLDGRYHSLVGVFPTRAVMRTKRAALGYRELTTARPSIWGEEGTVLRGHEFHYSTVEEMPGNIEKIYSVNDAFEGYSVGSTVGGYMHLHFGYNREAVSHFIKHCRGS